MSRWPADNQAALLKFYGTPGPDVDRQLVDVRPPFQMYYDGKPISRIRFHRKAAPALLAALNEIWEHYGRDQRKIDALGISKYAGAYNPRKVRGSRTKWSNHAFGAAIDINAEDNGFGKGHGTIPQPVIDAFKRQGARWGGDYRGRTDPMHFEFCDATGYPGPSSAPTKFFDPPPADRDSDAQIEGSSADQHHDDTEAILTPKQAGGFFPWLKRVVKSKLGWASGAIGGVSGASVMGFITDWRTIAAVTGLIVVLYLIYRFGRK